MNTVAVIGAGISGLATALFLQRTGSKVTVFEGDSLGGVIKTTFVQGYTLELGPNVLLERPELWELLGQVGLSDEAVFPAVPRYKQHLWFNGALHEVPKGPAKLLSTPLFPWSVKVKIPYLLLKAGVARPASEDESVAHFFSRLLGRQVVEDVIAPALQGIYGGDVASLSARTLFPELWATGVEGRSLLSYAKSKKPRRTLVMKGGMSSILDALEATLLKNGVTFVRKMVTSLTRNATRDGFTVAAEGNAPLHVSRVVVTTSGASSAPLVASFDNELATELTRLRYAPLVVAHLGVPAEAVADTPELLRSFGVLFPPRSSAGLLGVMFNSVLFPHVAPPGHHLLTICLGGMSSPEVVTQSDAQILATVERELSQRLHIRGGTLLSLHRWERAIPQYEVGHWKLVEQLRACEQRHPGLFFTGADLGGVGVPDRIRAARHFADLHGAP